MMANYFTLTRKGAKAPENFIELDEELCRMLDVEPHQTNWVADWYAIIGFRLSFGQSFDQLRAEFADNERLLRIINYLDANFEAHCWAGR